jgi:hypothetical protein
MDTAILEILQSIARTQIEHLDLARKRQQYLQAVHRQQKRNLAASFACVLKLFVVNVIISWTT